MSWRAKIGALPAALVVCGGLLGPVAQAAAPTQLTGTQLKAALLPVSYFPPGYKVEKVDNYNSGPRLEHTSARYHLGTFGCQHPLIPDFPETGFGETAAASNIISANLDGFLQMVYQFATPARAATFYQELYAYTRRCRTITISDHSTVTRSSAQFIGRTHVGRYPAFRVLATVTSTIAGSQLTRNDTTTTLAGTDVYSLTAAGQRAPATPAVPAALLSLIARVQAVR